MRNSLKLILILGVLFLGFYWIYLPVITRYRDLKTEEEHLRSEMTRLDENIKALQEERNLLKNDVAYLEKVIREELGLVKPGEVVYKFVTDPPQPEPAVAAPVEIALIPTSQGSLEAEAQTSPVEEVSA